MPLGILSSNYCLQVDPECSLLPDVVQPEVGKYDEDSRRVDQSAVVQQDPASKKRSDCVDEIAQTLAFTGGWNDQP